MTRQRNVTFQEALDDGWKPDSIETQEEESETVVKGGDNTGVLAEHANLVNLGASIS